MFLSLSLSLSFSVSLLCPHSICLFFTFSSQSPQCWFSFSFCPGGMVSNEFSGPIYSQGGLAKALPGSAPMRPKVHCPIPEHTLTRACQEAPKTQQHEHQPADGRHFDSHFLSVPPPLPDSFLSLQGSRHKPPDIRGIARGRSEGDPGYIVYRTQDFTRCLLYSGCFLCSWLHLAL